jgi:bifunctional non-homologous end joining protein LigD
MPARRNIHSPKQPSSAAEPLSEYRRKRDPKATPEPFGGAEGGDRPIFVVQRHDARRLHYDFRLERNGALASWAVPKGVPLEPGRRSLAVHVEDHPLDYATFAGEIPAGNYGAGTVEIWDHGTYDLVEEKRDGGLTVRLHGERLQGTWTLVPAKLDGDEKNWLLIRKREEGLSGSEPRSRPSQRYRPMLATLVDDVPAGPEWLHEVKWDGFRAVAFVRGGECELRSRTDKDLTARFPTVARALQGAVRTPDCVLDGEIVAIGADGRATFSAMQQGAEGTTYVYVAFDLLELDGASLVGLPLRDRRSRLDALVDRRRGGVQVSETFEDGEALLRAADEQRFEGIVSKRADSPYREGRRTREWLKIKTHGRQEFVIAGFTKGQGRRGGSFGALVLGVYDEDTGGLRWAGNVGTGFTDREASSLLGLLEPLARDACPFPEAPKMPRVRRGDVTWVEPRLVAEVEFVEWTHDGHLRAPSYKGLREDKPAEEVVPETPALPAELRKGGRILRLSNLDKPFWPEEGITKGDLLAYYRDVAPAVLPHLRGRPFTMRRYPDGWRGKSFFQKDAPKHMPDWIETRRFQVSTRARPPERKWIDFPVVNDELALLWMVNMGCIDLNAWYSRVDRPDRPDFVLFDLDPSADVGFRETVRVALLVREILDLLGLVGFAKTSGADGIHVLVPVERRYSYEDTRRFAEVVAGAIARAHPGLATTEWTKSRRRGVLIDSNQNGEGKTIASVYSVRPQAGAPVSTPLRWEEVDETLDPAAFTMDVVRRRVAEHGDLFAGVLTTRQRLEPALRKLG